MSTASDPARAEHLNWLIDVTQLPTAAGREWRVIDWIKRWNAQRPDLTLREDPAGNLIVAFSDPGATDQPPLFITAHLDHPAFVLARVVSPSVVELQFRGGVMDVFFEAAPVVIHPRSAGPVPATLAGETTPSHPQMKSYLAELDTAVGADALRPGDVATWRLPPAEVVGDILHTHACDDLSAVASAIATMDVLRVARAAGERVGHVSLLFTRAEEIGFIGAIAACRHGSIPRDARVLALENSRSFPDSPIGGGPIVRVGDRISTFSPGLTAACAARAEETFAAAAQPLSSQTAAQAKAAGGIESRPWQRKLMAGGACEASVFCAYGLNATCLCLPLGNYHNMANLAELQAGTYDAPKLGPARAAREFISVSDFHSMNDLLVAIALRLPPTDAFLGRVEKLYADKGFVLKEFA
jgi:putative aminopeptidase FrvX